jgi:hypothetical protein
MNLSDIGSTVAKYAPLLGMALSSPIGAVAAIGKVVADAFGADPKDAQQVISKINGDPDAQIKLLQIQQQYDIQCKQILQQTYQAELTHDQEMYKTEVNDRDSARKRAEAVKDWTPTVLAYLITGCFFAYVFKITNNGDISSTEQNVLIILSNIFIMVVSYYFGSSVSSRKKDDSISNMTKQIKG